MCNLRQRRIKGLKNKALKKINGKPLIAYTIKQAIKSKKFSHVIVSTDSKKLKKLQINSEQNLGL